ncbi:MAG: hypothetical protein ACFFCW_43385 [Candidatus Hodarchaeota archaeon]
MSKESFIVGFFIGIVLTGVVAYAALPMLESEETHEETGRILQMKYEEFRSTAFLMDSSTSNWTRIPDTEMNITTEGDSRLSVTFSAIGILHLDTTFTGNCKFNISLHIGGITSRQTRVSLYRGGSGATLEMSKTIYVHLETDTLPKGAYQISVNWIAQHDGIGSNQLILANTPFNFTRSLSVWEIST